MITAWAALDLKWDTPDTLAWCPEGLETWEPPADLLEWEPLDLEWEAHDELMNWQQEPIEWIEQEPEHGMD